MEEFVFEFKPIRPVEERPLTQAKKSTPDYLGLIVDETGNVELANELVKTALKAAALVVDRTEEECIDNETYRALIKLNASIRKYLRAMHAPDSAIEVGTENLLKMQLREIRDKAITRKFGN